MNKENYIRVCQKPQISKNEEIGRYFVNNISGWIKESLWEKIKLFEGYYQTPECIKVLRDMRQEIIIKGYCDTDNIKIPIMKSLIAEAKGTIWEINLRNKDLNLHPDCTGWMRVTVRFGDISMELWTKDHEKKVKELRKKAEGFNKIEKGDN